MISRCHRHTGKRFQINNIHLFHYPRHPWDFTPLGYGLCAELPPPKTVNAGTERAISAGLSNSSTLQQPKTWYPHWDLVGLKRSTQKNILNQREMYWIYTIPTLPTDRTKWGHAIVYFMLWNICLTFLSSRFSIVRFRFCNDLCSLVVGQTLHLEHLTLYNFKYVLIWATLAPVNCMLCFPYEIIHHRYHSLHPYVSIFWKLSPRWGWGFIDRRRWQVISARPVWQRTLQFIWKVSCWGGGYSPTFMELLNSTCNTLMAQSNSDGFTNILKYQGQIFWNIKCFHSDSVLIGVT